MKKTFKITDPKIARPRRIEAIKYEVRKYLQRERRKPLPTGVDYWDFACRFGTDEANSAALHVADINTAISRAEDEQLESFYLEILARPGIRNKSGPT